MNQHNNSEGLEQRTSRDADSSPQAFALLSHSKTIKRMGGLEAIQAGYKPIGAPFIVQWPWDHHGSTFRGASRQFYIPSQEDDEYAVRKVPTVTQRQLRNHLAQYSPESLDLIEAYSIGAPVLCDDYHMGRVDHVAIQLFGRSQSGE